VSLYTTIRLPVAKPSSGVRPPPPVSVLSGASSGSLIDQVRTGRRQPTLGSFDPFSKRAGTSTLSQLFGDWGYGGIFRTIERPAITGPVDVKRTGAVITVTPKKIAPPVISLEPGIPLERLEPNRFSAPSLGQLTGGGPVISVPDPVRVPTAPLPKKEIAPVSIWSDLGKSITKGITTGVAQKISGQQKVIPAVAAVAGVGARVLPSLGRVLGSRTVAAGATGIAIGGLIGGGGW